MSTAIPPAPSFVITRTEEWPDADFDLPDDQESFAVDDGGDDLADSANRIKGRPSLSGAGAVAKLGGAPVEDEDWDAEFEDAPIIKSATASSANSSTSNFTGNITRLGSKEPRKAKENVEDWSDDGDLDLPEPSHTNFTLARASLPQPNAPESEDTGDVSTIKIAKLNFPSVSKSSLQPVEDEDFEADFALPAEMSNLSLRMLTSQTSSLLLRKSSTLVEGNGPWGDLNTSTSAYSDTSSLLSMYPPDASPSASSASQPGTETDPSDADFGIYEDEEDAFDGLVLPEGLSGKSLAKHFETKKQVVPAKIAAENDAKGSLTSQTRRANEAEDFETDLVIGDEDISISRLRQRRMENPSEYRSKSVPLPRTVSGGYRPSSSRLRTESVLEVLSASKVPTINRSRSPSAASQRSLSRKDSRSSIVSPTNFSSLRPSSVRAASSSHALPSTANLLSIPGSSSISGIAPRAAPLKHQKSLGRLQLSSTSSPTASSFGQKLGRKASLASLAGEPSPVTPASLSARPGGFNAPTAASKARRKPEEADKKKTHAVPPTRPTTPSANPVALRLTMPTSSSRQKIRPSISNVFPSPATATATTTPIDRTTSPQPNPRRTPTSPRRVRTRSGASHGGTPSSSISSISATAPKVMRKPKRMQAFSDGTELDAFDDLPEDTEKERKYRVQALGRGNVSVSRVEKGGSTATGGTFGRKSAATLRRPPSSASSHGSVDPPRNTGMQSLRHRPRVDFPVKVTIPEQTPRRKKPTVTAIGGPRKKPMLIRNLGGAGTAKTVGDMKWNPKTLRWEGNEQVLKQFDAHAAPSRPALITHMTGSSIGGLMSPTGSMLASGARIVGNMLFDPVRMCWISRLPPEEDEPDVFAGLVDDQGDWEDKAGTIRANTGGANATDDWKGSVRSTDSIREMTLSPARSQTRSMSESGSEAGDTPSAFGAQRRARESLGGQSVHEEVPGVDDALIAGCRAAEERHKIEMKGWYIRSRARSRSVKSSTEEEVPARTHLFDIRALATRKY